MLTHGKLGTNERTSHTAEDHWDPYLPVHLPASRKDQKGGKTKQKN